MGHTPSSTIHPVHHPFARAAGIDFAIVVFSVAAVVLSFFTGQGVANWRNVVFAPIVFVLAAITMRLVIAEVRALRPLPSAGHPAQAVGDALVALIAVVVVGPMLLIMPFVFLGAIT